jgi:porin
MAVAAAVTIDRPCHAESAALTGDWDARGRLSCAGVEPFASLTEEAWGNVGGGLKTGAWWNQLLDFGANFDGDKLIGLPGSSLFVQAHWVKNSANDECFLDYTGTASPASGIAAMDHFRIYNLYYRQTLKGCYFKIGQLAADDDFMLSNFAGLFANSTLGAMPSQVDMPSFPVFPVAAPGVFFSYSPSEQFYAQSGVYYGHPGNDVPGNAGFDWVEQSDFAVAAFYEAGVHYHISGHAATVRLGGTYFCGDYAEYASIGHGHNGGIDNGIYSFYVIHDVVLLQSDKGDPILGGFVRSGFKPRGDESIVAAYVDTGVNWFGPLPCRPQDVAGVAYACTVFGRNYRESTAPGGVAASESTVAIAYKAQITRWFSLQADVQLLFNPAINPESHNREMAQVIGLRGRIDF